MNGEEQNTNSDFSNPNSNNNLIGIKSPTNNSDNSDNILIALDDDIKNEINEYKFKKCFSYRDKFRKDIEIQLKQRITEHYNDCINKLRDITKRVNAISDVNPLIKPL